MNGRIEICDLLPSDLRRAFSSEKVKKVVCLVCETRQTGDHLDEWLSRMALNGKFEILFATSPENCLAGAMQDDVGVVRIFWFRVTQANCVWQENGGKPGVDCFCFTQRARVNGGGKHMVWFGGMTEHSAGLIRDALFD